MLEGRHDRKTFMESKQFNPFAKRGTMLANR